MIWESVIEVKTEKGSLCLRYFVSPPQCGEEISVPCYGIGISDGRETCTARAFSPDREEAVSLMMRLCRMRVTPTTFFEVLDDYLAEQ